MSEHLANARDRLPDGPHHDERFDPDARSEELTGSEHLARYLWASQVATDKDVLDAGCGLGYGSRILAEAGGRVTGVDRAQAAIDECVGRIGDAAQFRVADLVRLPLAPGSFDVVVCFEVIEHVADPTAVLDEVQRMLRPGGIAIVSSPNRGIYVPGNPHHVVEYTSQELLDALGERFAHTSLHRQHPWLASCIEPADNEHVGRPEQLLEIRVGRTTRLELGAETYAIVVASDAKLPSMSELVVMGEAFEVRWFHDKIDWQSKAEQENALLRERQRVLETGLARTGQRLLEAEAENARIPQLEQDIAALRVIEAERDLLAWRLERADRVHAEMKSSISWRLTAPLRVLARLVREPSPPAGPQPPVPPGGRGTA